MLKMLSRVSVELVVFVAIITSIVSAASATEDSWFGPEFSVLQKVYDDCLDKDDFTGCLKGRALVALNKAISQVRYSILPRWPRCVCICKIFLSNGVSNSIIISIFSLLFFRSDFSILFRIFLCAGFNFDC